MMSDDTYEANNLACSLPLIKLAQKMSQLDSGALFEFTTNNPGFEEDIRIWCRETGNMLCNFRKENGYTAVIIMKVRPDTDAAAGGRDSTRA